MRREPTDFHELAGALSRLSNVCSRVARARDAVDLATEQLRMIAAGERLPRTRRTTARITTRTSRFFKLLAGGAAI